MSSEEIKQLNNRLNQELTKVNLFIQITNKTLETMQQSDTLTMDNLKRLAHAVDDFTVQMSLQQKQIEHLVQMVQIIQTVSQNISHEPPAQSEQEPETVRSNTIACPPANDGMEKNEIQSYDHDNDEADASNK